MRRNTVILASLATTVAGAALVGLLLPSFLETRARAWVDQTVADTLDAKVGFEGVRVSLLSSFPRATVRVAGLTVDGQGSFEGTQLASIPELSLTVGLGSLLGGGPIAIHGVTLTEPALHLVVDSEGRANYDIVKGGEGEASTYDLGLEAVSVVDGAFTYEDLQGDSALVIRDLDHTSSGAATQDVIRLATNTTIAGLTYESADVALLRDVAVKADAGVEYAMGSGAITLGEGRIGLNELLLSLDGSLTPQGEDWAVDVKVGTLDTAFKTLLSLVPSAYSADFADVDAAGSVSIEGAAKGLYKSAEDHLPALDFALKVADGRFAYPGLPQSVEQIAADVVIAHPEGAMDLTVIDVKRFTLNTAGAPFGGAVRIAHPVTDPDLAAKVHGRLDLGALRAALPDDGSVYSGVVDANLDVRGRMSSFEASNAEEVDASGTLAFANVKYSSPDWPVPFDVAALDVAFTPKHADVKTLKLTFGESDLEGSGTLGGLIPYALGQGKLTGTFVAKGDRLDLTPFEGGEEEAAGGEEEAIVVVPTDLDLDIRAAWARVKVMGHELEDVRGTLVVRDGAVRMDPLHLKVLGGTVTVTGLYAAPTADNADVEMTIALAGFDVGRTVEAFTTLGRIVPVAKGATGRFDSGFELETRLGPDGTPDLAGLFSKGRVETFGLTLGPEPITKVGELLKNKKLTAVKLDGAEAFYELRDGKLLLEPLVALLGDVPTTISGGAGVLDQTMDLALDLKLPTAALAGAAFLGGQALIGDETPVRVLLQGPWADPKVSAALGEGGPKAAVQAVVAGVVDDLVAKAREKGDALVAKAQAGADALRAEAKKAGDKLRSEAKTRGAALAKEAKGSPLKEAAAKEAAKKLEVEADKAAKKLDKEADTKGDALVADAKASKEKLIAEAQAKTKAR